MAEKPGSTVKPLFPIASYDDAKGDVTAESIETFAASPSFNTIADMFQDYPEQSLLSDASRALLYHVVRTRKPQISVEIGTYFAGTAEVLSRALWENGSRHLYTVDPFGRERCPDIIAAWPAELHPHVTYTATNSMGLLSSLEQARKPIDFAFIDGNHEYEYATFDIGGCARLMAPGGIIAIDNIEQSGPFFAALDFQKHNPGWEEIGDTLKAFRPDAPFLATRRTGILDSSLVLLRAPTRYVVRSAPTSTGQIPYPESRIAYVGLSMASAAPRGSIYAQTILRGFSNAPPPDTRVPEEHYAVHSLRLGGEREATLSFAPPLTPDFSPLKHTVEIVLFWVPDEPGEPLILLAPPQPFPS